MEGTEKKNTLIEQEKETGEGRETRPPLMNPSRMDACKAENRLRPESSTRSRIKGKPHLIQTLFECFLNVRGDDQVVV